MGTPNRPNDDSISLPDHERMDVLQDGFESAWRRGEPTPIEALCVSITSTGNAPARFCAASDAEL